MSIGASGVDRQATDTVPQSGFYGDCRANKADVFVLAGADGRARQKCKAESPIWTKGVVQTGAKCQPAGVNGRVARDEWHQRMSPTVVAGVITLPPFRPHAQTGIARTNPALSAGSRSPVVE
jgi:hypothetical protein